MEVDHGERKFIEDTENEKKKLALEEKKLELERLRFEQEIKNNERSNKMFEALLSLLQEKK